MEPTPAPTPPVSQVPTVVCPVCHLAVLSQYYFCPNCGAEVRPVPLSTSPETQAWMYVHSIILPMILFLSISKWKGYRYFKSEEPEAKQVGTVAVVLLILSTLTTFYLAYVWTTETIQSSIDSINVDMSI